MTKEQSLNEIDEAIKAVVKLSSEQSVGSASKVRLTETMFHLVERYAPLGSSFRVKAAHLREGDAKYPPGTVLQPLKGLVSSLRDAIEADQLVRIEGLARAETFSDFLSMSQHLLEEGYKDASAVIAGTVVEQHLRALCQLGSIPTTQPDGKWKKAETLNQDLARERIISTLEQKQITSWLGLRNAAAHGEYHKYEEPNVRLMIDGITIFLLQHPA